MFQADRPSSLQDLIHLLDSKSILKQVQHKVQKDSLHAFYLNSEFRNPQSELK